MVVDVSQVAGCGFDGGVCCAVEEVPHWPYEDVPAFVGVSGDFDEGVGCFQRRPWFERLREEPEDGNEWRCMRAEVGKATRVVVPVPVAEPEPEGTQCRFGVTSEPPVAIADRRSVRPARASSGRRLTRPAPRRPHLLPVDFSGPALRR